MEEGKPSSFYNRKVMMFMKFKLRFWNAIDNLFWLILGILLIHKSYELSNVMWCIPFGVIGSIIIICIAIRMLVTSFPEVDKPIKETVQSCKYTNIDYVRDYINREYVGFENLNKYDYYYDRAFITQNFKPISFGEYLKHIFHNDCNLVYTFEVEIKKMTEKLHLENTLKTIIIDGRCIYSMGDYTFYEDEKQQISSLANNQEMKLDIVYNKLFLRDGLITRYVIVNADTKERL